MFFPSDIQCSCMTGSVSWTQRPELYWRPYAGRPNRTRTLLILRTWSWKKKKRWRNFQKWGGYQKLSAGLRESPDLTPSSHCYIEKKGTEKPSSLIDLNLSFYKFHRPSAFSEEKSRNHSVLIKITALCYLLLFCNKEILIFLSSPKLKVISENRPV